MVFKKSRPKTPINFYGYSRNLSKNRVKTSQRYDDNFDILDYLSESVNAELKVFLKIKNDDSMETDENLCDNYRDRIKNLNGYMELINFCFKYLGKSGDDVKNVNSDFYNVASKDPIKVTIENSKIQYSIDDILTKYFRNISTVTQEVSEVEVNFHIS